jgi:putative transposase
VGLAPPPLFGYGTAVCQTISGPSLKAVTISSRSLRIGGKSYSTLLRRDFSTRWASIKGLFSQQYLREHSNIIATTTSRRRKGEVCIWQRRFWEHQIRDENDLNKHVDYIHYNPVKHGLVARVEDWPWSTYHRYVKEGFYKGDKRFADVMQGTTTDFGE